MIKGVSNSNNNRVAFQARLVLRPDDKIVNRIKKLSGVEELCGKPILAHPSQRNAVTNFQKACYVWSDLKTMLEEYAEETPKKDKIVLTKLFVPEKSDCVAAQLTYFQDIKGKKIPIHSDYIPLRGIETPRDDFFEFAQKVEASRKK